MDELIKNICWTEKLDDFSIHDSEISDQPCSDLNATEQADPTDEQEQLRHQTEISGGTQLYQWPDLQESLAHFDSDDLDARYIFVLVLDGGRDCVIWVGDRSDPEELKAAVSYFPEAEVVSQGREAEAFWDLFPDG
jgi:hypothetical protein